MEGEIKQGLYYTIELMSGNTIMVFVEQIFENKIKTKNMDDKEEFVYMHGIIRYQETTKEKYEEAKQNYEILKENAIKLKQAQNNEKVRQA